MEDPNRRSGCLQPAPAIAEPYYNNHSATYLRRIFNDPAYRRDLGCIFALVICISMTIISMIDFLILWAPSGPEFRVDSLSLPKFSLAKNSTLISFTCHVRLIATNPNKKWLIYHHDVDAYLLHGNDILTNTTIPPFSQATNNETSVAVNFVDVVDKRVLEGINRESVNLNLMIYSNIWFEISKERIFGITKERILKVFCLHLVVTDGEFTGVPKHCRLYYRFLV